MKVIQEQETKVYAFIKAIDKQYYDSFMNDGEICLNTTKWFRDYEKQDDNIGDGSEGAKITCAKDFYVQFGDPILSYSSEEDLKAQKESRDLSDPISGKSLNIFDGNDANIFSLYAITLSKIDKKEYTHFVSKRFVDEFSNHRFVLILNPKDFFVRVAKTLIDLGKFPIGSIVKYYPFDGFMRTDLNNFHKREKYSYQNEYRILFQDINPEMQIIKVGSLSDIAFEINLYKHSYFRNFRNFKLTIEMSSKIKNTPACASL